MKMMMKVIMPVEQGNRALKEGILQKTVSNFVESTKPEGIYFTTMHGKRSGFFFFEMKDATLMPTLAEPFFQNLDAEVYLTPVMDLGDLRSGLEKIPKNI